MPQPHPQNNSTLSPVTAFLLVCFLLTALFPGLFVSIFWAPYHSLVAWAIPNSAQQRYKSTGRVDCEVLKDCGISATATASMSWFQTTVTLPSKSRGSYLITPHIERSLPQIREYKTGLLNLFVQHTSCALSLNENWDEDVRADMSDALDRIVPEDKKGEGIYRHDAEGSDDMPAHVKSALIGASVTIPITNGRLATGTWQGIWYLEFRDMKHTRKVVATIQGEKM